jgi:hypothetical protein
MVVVVISLRLTAWTLPIFRMMISRTRLLFQSCRPDVYYFIYSNLEMCEIEFALYWLSASFIFSVLVLKYETLRIRRLSSKAPVIAGYSSHFSSQTSLDTFNGMG